MSIRNLFLSVLLIAMLSGCSKDLFLVHNGNMPSSENIANVHKGQTRAEVESILGSPSAMSTFNNTWIYMSSTMKKVAFLKPQEINREILEIYFDADDKVSEIKTYDKNDGVQIAIATEETPVAGHNIGFFRKYFGGVGTFSPIAPSQSSNGI